MGNFVFCALLIFSVFLFYQSDRKDSKFLLVMGILIVSLLSGFRGINVGFDTAYYYDAFLNSFPKSWQFEETGFRFITNFLMNTFNRATIVMIIYALITNFLIFFRLWDFRKKCNFSAMSILYILIFFIDSMNIMRQFIAISIIFFSTRFLEKKKYILFLIIVLLCTYIHKSCLLALIILVVYGWKSLSKRNKMLLIVPIIVLSVLGIRLVYNFESADIENYLSQSNSVSNFNITFIYRFSIFVISYLLNRSKIKIVISSRANLKNNKYEDSIKENKNEFNIISVIYLLGLCLGSFGMFFLFLSRIGYYCLFFELLYWGYLTYNNKNKNLNFGMIMIYAVYIFALEVINNGSRIFPYYINFI